MTINEKQDQLIGNFTLFDEWLDKYEYIIDLGKKLLPLNEQYKIEENKIKGCQSTVWLHTEMKDGHLVFKADSDPTAFIVKGLVSILIHVLSGHTPEEIINADLYFINQIGMDKHFMMTRSNGLSSMMKRMKTDALAYQAKMS